MTGEKEIDSLGWAPSGYRRPSVQEESKIFCGLAEKGTLQRNYCAAAHSRGEKLIALVEFSTHRHAGLARSFTRTATITPLALVFALFGATAPRTSCLLMYPKSPVGPQSSWNCPKGYSL